MLTLNEWGQHSFPSKRDHLRVVVSTMPQTILATILLVNYYRKRCRLKNGFPKLFSHLLSECLLSITKAKADSSKGAGRMAASTSTALFNCRKRQFRPQHVRESGCLQCLKTHHKMTPDEMSHCIAIATPRCVYHVPHNIAGVRKLNNIARVGEISNSESVTPFAIQPDFRMEHISG